MATLVSNGDREVLLNSSFIKNAVMYKDMLAFYNAYINLMDKGLDGLPNYCKLGNGTLCLEGICLFMKNYATELGFESAKLTLGYLKVIYYTIASLSDGKNFPERSVIEEEYKKYRENNFRQEVAPAAHGIIVQDEGKPNVQARGNKNWLLCLLSIVCAACSALFLVMFFAKILGAAICVTLAGVFLLACVGLAITCFIRSKKPRAKAHFAVENSAAPAGRSDEQTERIIVEKYEASCSFNRSLSKRKASLSFDEVWNKAKEYRLLSYNIKLDVISLFESQGAEVKAVMNQIQGSSGVVGENSLSEIYKLISEKDWLKFNGEVRDCFLQKMVELSTQTQNWKIQVGSTKVDPFGINVKDLGKQTVTFLNSQSENFAALPLDVLLKLNIVKNSNALNFGEVKTADDLRRLKANCISHFFSFEGTKKYANMFYGNGTKPVKVQEEILKQNAEIPAFLWITIKNLESKLGLENADAKAIHEIEKIVDSYEGGTPYKLEGLSVMVADSVSGGLSEIYATDLENYGISYKIGDTTFIGYRI